MGKSFRSGVLDFEDHLLERFVRELRIQLPIGSTGVADIVVAQLAVFACPCAKWVNNHHPLTMHTGIRRRLPDFSTTDCGPTSGCLLWRDAGRIRVVDDDAAFKFPF